MTHPVPHKFLSNQIHSRMKMTLPLIPPANEEEVANDGLQLKGKRDNLNIFFFFFFGGDGGGGGVYFLKVPLW